MPKDFIPSKIGDRVPFYKNLAATAATEAAALSLTPSELTTLQNVATDFGDANLAVQAAYDAYRAALETRKIAEAAAESLTRGYNRQWQNTGVPASVIASLGLPVHESGPTFSPPASPLTLSATAFSNGEVKLKWKRNGNIDGTQFVVETSADGQIWQFLTVSTSSRLSLNHFEPGVRVYFRVYAKRRTEVSAPSPATVIYPGQTGQIMRIAS
ncbi:MAG: fibronectin type III domain-containing protein [Armatimonadetes bacterium]|nr:fibronectin type III domain-containing protein [Armatimonadota bacterium]